ncbi:TrkH family potassium uptake protein [Marinomonas fungiae]|uniref:Trk system potassium uptake protein n=1 Tax=Marinomonas fungiae TaxID=1137284 RepID=A0A0K6IMI5_9GAMM|nr:TrkH family potassium uptake protein [Marinomonas fungiae]CUB04308.1 potassium uptake protein, TrkH family [Marinomonas fungiae]
MIRVTLMARLLALPALWMGTVQLVFAELSFYLFMDGMGHTFFYSAAVIMALSIAVLFGARRYRFASVNSKEAIFYAVLTWITVGFLGAIPIFFVAGVSWTDAVFESVSALTTTGATILSGLDAMPKSFLMYRQFLQWMGGLGVVIFVVAVLPMLNIGGMRLLKAETVGPVKDEKLTPKVKKTARYLWYVYLLITLMCAICYWLAGMSAYDAIAHSFTTVSTGGFSTHDASMGYFQSDTILWICCVFMALGAISFSLHYRVLAARQMALYWQDEECRWFLLIALAFSAMVAQQLWQFDEAQGTFAIITQATFHVLSFMTSTGYGAAGFTEWHGAAPILLLVVGYVGGCAGSTAGGNKVVRNVISFKSILLEVKQLVHPSGVFTIRYQHRPINEQIRNSVMSFMCLAAITTTVLTLLLMMTGVDFVSALSAVAACLNVLGPGFGELGSNFAPLTDSATWLMSFAMILGRLEYFTVIAIFTSLLWRE